jgi:hypothetical protein
MLDPDSEEYCIDINILEQEGLYQMLGEVCGRFPERSREQHLSFISARLAKRARRGESAFFWDSDSVGYGARRDVTTADALNLLQLPETWEFNENQYLAAREIWNYDSWHAFAKWLWRLRRKIFRLPTD